MKYKLKHITRSFNITRNAAFLTAVALLIIYVAAGFTIEDEILIKILVGAEALCIGTAFIASILSALDYIYGARVIVESDYLKIKKLFYVKKIHFDEIADTSYSYYYEDERSGRSYSHHRKYGSAFNSLVYNNYNNNSYSRRCNSLKVDIILTSGKKISLNDKMTGYKKNQRTAIYDHSVDPNADIPLYQALQCYRSARAQYTNNML